MEKLHIQMPHVLMKVKKFCSNYRLYLAPDRPYVNNVVSFDFWKEFEEKGTLLTL